MRAYIIFNKSSLPASLSLIRLAHCKRKTCVSHVGIVKKVDEPLYTYIYTHIYQLYKAGIIKLVLTAARITMVIQHYQSP